MPTEQGFCVLHLDNALSQDTPGGYPALKHPILGRHPLDAAKNFPVTLPQRRRRTRPEIRGAALGVLGQCIGVAAIGGVIVGLVAEELTARAAVGLSTGLGLTLLIPVIILSPLARRPVTPPPD